MAIAATFAASAMAPACTFGNGTAEASDTVAVAGTLPQAEVAHVAPAGAPQGQRYIHIDKQTMTLSVIAPDGSVEAKFGCATGKVPGHKQRRGDMRTPEGRFTISQIQDASSWTHDFGDGKGVIEGAYGPRFIRLQRNRNSRHPRSRIDRNPCQRGMHTPGKRKRRFARPDGNRGHSGGDNTRRCRRCRERTKMKENTQNTI